jgi:DNA-binding IclR family transcriptional regulator
MFGDKRAKLERLEQMAKLLEQHPEGMSQSDLARGIGAPRSTVKRDLPALEQAGILLTEDDRGQLALFGRRR